MKYSLSRPKLGFSPSRTSSSSCERKNLGGSVFRVDGLLRPEECVSLIESSTPLLEPVDWEYVSSYRSCDRAIFSSLELADCLSARLRSVLEVCDLSGVQPAGYGSEGEWVLAGGKFVNHVFRVSKYPAGSFFAKHRDNGFVFSDDHRSIMTLVVYLSEGHEEGKTVFYPSPKADEIVVDPAVGRGVCFNHDVLHEGTAVKGGTKWVLRTDIMFQRVECLPFLKFSYLADPRYLEAEKNYQLSITLQKQGLPKESTDAFLLATELHAALASDRNQKRSAPTSALTTILPRDVWVEICLMMMDVADVVVVSRLNSYFLKLVRTSTRLWYDLFLRRWPAGTNPRTVAQFSEALGDSVSFYSAFKSRFIADRNFRVVALDLSCNLACSTSPNLSWFSARAGYAGGHLWCAGNGMNTAVGHELETGEFDYYFSNEGHYISEQLYHGPGEAPCDEYTLATLVPHYHQWFGPIISLEKGDAELPGGFNAVVAGLVCRYAMAQVNQCPYGQYYGDTYNNPLCGKNPVLAVVAPFVLQGNAVEVFYRAFNSLNPGSPYILLYSMSELLSLYYDAPNCLAFVLGDCSVCFSVVVNSHDDEILQERFPTSLFTYRMVDPIAARDAACESLLGLLPTLNGTFWQRAKAALARTKFKHVIVGGLATDSIAQAIEKLMGVPVLRPAADDWWDVSRIAMTAFCSAPAAQKKFQALELRKL